MTILRLCAIFAGSLCLLLIEVVDVLDAVLHQHQMCILVWSLLRLPLLNPFVQEVYSLLILFFQLCFDAFILYILQSIHLELITWIFGLLGHELA